MPDRIKIALVTLVTAGAVAVLAGAAAVWAGLFDVAASSGHSAFAQWFLHLAMRRSVAARAPDRPLPGLDGPAFLVRGAAQFERGCAPCHGSPLTPPSVIEQGATPPPPPLDRVRTAYSAGELHWIIGHGVKRTAMPAWPAASRGDEIWPLVAFLEKLPELDPGTYRALALGADAPSATLVAAGGELAAGCAACHGPGGDGRAGAFPRLAGLDPRYLAASLDAYASGARPSGVMQPVAAALSRPERLRLAAQFSAQPTTAERASAAAVDPGPARAGAVLATQGAPLRGIPACVTCHAPDAAGRSPGIPDLSGQPAWYLARQLTLFRQGDRAGTPDARVMARLAAPLRPDEIQALAAYFAGAAPQPAGGPAPVHPALGGGDRDPSRGAAVPATAAAAR
jgi:cytochrome c553